MKEKSNKNFLNNFDSLPLKKLLPISQGFLLLVIIIAGLLCIIGVRNISDNIKTLYNQPHTNLIGMWQIKTEIAQTGNGIRAWAMDGTVLPTSLADNITLAEEQIETIEANKVTENDEESISENMQNVIDAIHIWSTQSSKIVEALQNNREIKSSAFIEYTNAEQDAINSIDKIIETASANAVGLHEKAQAQATQTTVVIIVVFAIAAIVTLLMLRLLIKAIFIPLGEILKTSNSICAGDLNSELTYKANNEFGELADCFRDMQEYLKNSISDFSNNLEKISKGDLRVKAEAEYRGEFIPLRDAFLNAAQKLSMAIEQIRESANNVNSGSDQVAASAQSLAQGVTEQASAVNELAATIEDIADQVNHSAENARIANEKAKQVGCDARESNQRMHELLKAMDNINESSQAIEKIIKTIEAIAFQTNILSLNASVEAARAGSSSKGFAVIADEIRNLANKSSEAINDSSALINRSLTAVANGTKLANDTAKSLEGVVNNIEDSLKSINDITVTSQGQAASIQQIKVGIDQINSVVQLNSASAEESASASMELTSHAQEMDEFVKTFVTN